MENISTPVIRKDHEAKISGRERYVGDLKRAEDGGEILTARLVRTSLAHAEILGVTLPELPEGYTYVDGRDAPRNVAWYPLNDTAAVLTPEEAEIIKNSTPLFADRTSEYAGQPVGMIVDPDPKTVRHLAARCRVECRSCRRWCG